MLSSSAKKDNVFYLPQNHHTAWKLQILEILKLLSDKYVLGVLHPAAPQIYIDNSLSSCLHSYKYFFNFSAIIGAKYMANTPLKNENEFDI